MFLSLASLNQDKFGHTGTNYNGVSHQHSILSVIYSAIWYIMDTQQCHLVHHGYTTPPSGVVYPQHQMVLWIHTVVYHGYTTVPSGASRIHNSAIWHVMDTKQPHLAHYVYTTAPSGTLWIHNNTIWRIMDTKQRHLARYGYTSAPFGACWTHPIVSRAGLETRTNC